MSRNVAYLVGHLTDHQYIDLVRVLVGLQPLYAAKPDRQQGSGYESLEALSRAASPGCRRCGGAGYFDSWCTGEICSCTGLQRARRNPGGRKQGTGDNGFSYRGPSRRLTIGD